MDEGGRCAHGGVMNEEGLSLRGTYDMLDTLFGIHACTHIIVDGRLLLRGISFVVTGSSYRLVTGSLLQGAFYRIR